MVTVIGNFNGVPTGLKFFSIRNNAFFDSPSELLQVRLFNLHRQMLFNPTLSNTVDPLKEATPAEKSLADLPFHDRFMQVYRSSSSNPHRLQTFYVRFRPGLWRPEEMSTKAEQMSSPVIEGNVLWNFSVMFLLGLAFFLAATSVVLCILRICFKPSPEEQEIGFLYGYQELPSAEESEKEAAQKEYAAKEAAQKEFAAKESAAKAESVAIVP
ncbi:hypothetical protein KP509_10G023200 [Ceratopteris richardii]|nr:hypothetical protein KP509_10G023200 [Ceratopteris richardii]